MGVVAAGSAIGTWDAGEDGVVLSRRLIASWQHQSCSLIYVGWEPDISIVRVV